MPRCRAPVGPGPALPFCILLFTRFDLPAQKPDLIFDEVGVTAARDDPTNGPLVVADIGCGPGYLTFARTTSFFFVFFFFFFVFVFFFSDQVHGSVGILL